MGISTGFCFKVVAHDIFDLGKARSLSQQHLQLRDRIALTLGDAFYIPILQVADKAAQIQLVRMMQDVASEADSLHLALDEKVDGGHIRVSC